MNEFAQRFFQDLKEQLPQAAQLLPKKDIQAALQSSLSRLDLVTREEFDAQSAVLQRTRQRLETLEAELAKLQTQLDKPVDENAQ